MDFKVYQSTISEIKARGSFIFEDHVPALIAFNRLGLVLVRCGGGRFLCPVQDLNHFLACIRAGGDYLRDVSIPAGRIPKWEAVKPPIVTPQIPPLPGMSPLGIKPTPVNYRPSSDLDDEYRGDADPGL